MIGVIADPGDQDVVGEFFQLFKTPWELARPGRRYDVLLCAGGSDVSGAAADLVLVYAAGRTPVDDDTTVKVAAPGTGTVLAYAGHRLPIYGTSVTFDRDELGLITNRSAGRAGAYMASQGERTVVRVGYDLFREVRTLLTDGQPLVNAGLPTLDLHIALLRELITSAAIPLIEIPPVPLGYQFIACLTHDVDHASLRRHTWDHTALGFLYRACVGSVANVWRGRASARDLLTNWAAAVRLPFVHLGLARDFWRQFDRYLNVDPPGSSTFFVIPFEGYAGRTAEGRAPAFRASRYGARHIADEVRSLVSAGCEIGVHGLDAWLDSARGVQELTAVAQITGASDVGVRSHWLYGAENSPAVLEKAGFAYDSTNGYNETVGYRAGTSQVFKPFEALRLLELPLHVMDTALFYPSHLGLSAQAARGRVGAMIDHAVRFGGTVTVNWHDRSIAPERLWTRPYEDLVAAMKGANAWFATAARAVAWFRQRRSAVFESVAWEPGLVRARLSFDPADGLPGLWLRVHSPSGPPACDALGHIRLLDPSASQRYVDVAANDRNDTCIRI